MKQVYGAGALQILPCQNGFIFVTKQEEHEDKAVIAYKMLDFERMTLSPVTRSVYLLAKFGSHFERFEDNPEDFLSVQTLFLPDRRLLMVRPDGQARVLEPDGRTRWQGQLTYEQSGPGGLALGESCFWVSFPRAGAVARYSLRNFRLELRIGGNQAIPTPEGLYYSNETLLICAGQQGKLLELDLRDFSLADYHTFDEPVHRYIKYNANEIVLLDSGIYKL